MRKAKRFCVVCGGPAPVVGNVGNIRFRRCARDHRTSYDRETDRLLGLTRRHVRGLRCRCGKIARVESHTNTIRVCPDGHRGVYVIDGKRSRFIRDVLTPAERIVAPDRFPLCALEYCDRLRASVAMNKNGGGTRYCHGHDKQKDRGQPFRPLLSADPKERMRQIQARRLTTAL